MEQRHDEQRAVAGSQLVGGHNVGQAGCQVGMRQRNPLWPRGRPRSVQKQRNVIATWGIFQFCPGATCVERQIA